jgi:hypothetical protein
MHVELQGFDEMGRRLEQYPRRTTDELRSTMQAGLLLLEADQRRHVAQDTRRLLGSITNRIEGSGQVLTGRVGPTTRYAFWVEYGRRPGRYPPLAAIAGWARRHGVHPFVVARAIARRGTRPQPFVGPSLERNRVTLERMFARVGARVTAFLAGR